MAFRSVRSLAPRVCPQCETEKSFTIQADRIICRRCGYIIRKEDGTAQSPADEVANEDQYGPRQPLIPSYAISHVGEVNRWARSAYDTGQSYVHRQKWDEAVEAFYRALESQPDFVDAHLWIALLTKDEAVKREHLTTVLAHQPNHIEAIRELMILDGKLSPGAASLYDPHAEPEMREAGGAVATETENLRCPRCGSPNMSTDDVTGLSYCDSCGYIDESSHGADVDGGMLTMALLQRRAQPVKWVVGERLLACNSCGAERTIPARKLSQRCPFCGSNHIIQKDALESFQQPDGLVPFAISRDAAGKRVKEQLAGWTERVKGWFANNTVKRATLDGVYLPFWTFDAMVEVRRTRIEMPNQSRDNGGFFPQAAYPVHRTETLADAMNNVLICGVKSPPPLLTGKLGSYDLDAMVAYEPALLAKYPAELYSIDFDKASLEARSIVGREMREKHTMTASSGGQINIFTEFKQMTFQLALLPVWVATLYEEDGDIRTALVNGQTGQVALGKAHKPRA